MKRLLTTFCMTSILFFSDIKAVEEFRSWTNKDGNSIEAKFIKFKEEQIEIRRRDGFTFTLDPSTLSQDDQDYLAELEKHKDSAGRVWNKGSYLQELVRQKWFDSLKGKPIMYYHEFNRSEKVDLDKDGKEDGFKVLKWANAGYDANNKRANAWEMDDEGILTYKYFSIGKIRESKYKYDFGKKSFIRLDGYYGPSFFIPAE